jgi:hypothetical protein
MDDKRVRVKLSFIEISIELRNRFLRLIG